MKTRITISIFLVLIMVAINLPCVLGDVIYSAIQTGYVVWFDVAGILLGIITLACLLIIRFGDEIRPVLAYLLKIMIFLCVVITIFPLVYYKFIGCDWSVLVDATNGGLIGLILYIVVYTLTRQLHETKE